MKTIAIIIGTRPEAIKMAPIYIRLKESSFNPILVATGQHREMLYQALSAFNIRPNISLDFGKLNKNLADNMSDMISLTSGLFERIKPDAVLVQGDTTTVAGTALAAAYSRIPLGHVEAGLRTYSNEPFPEELNRRIVAPIARWSFAPTTTARDNLVNERIDPASIHVVGNSVIDALMMVEGKKPDSLSDEFLQRLYGPWVLVTCHRRESFGSGIERVCQALLQLADKGIPIIFPVHLNPNIREPVNRLINHPNIALIDPVEYTEFVWLMKNCHCILTDSGGIQEEAPSLGKPVLVMRDVTERPEAVIAGTSKLVGTDTARIVEETMLLVYCNKEEYLSRTNLVNPYGDGKTSNKIAAILEESFNGGAFIR